MPYWLFKEEPTHYSYADLERDGATVWDGVSNNTALLHLRKVARGDHVLFYHTGDERAAVGEMEVTSDPYPDPALDDSKLVVVDVKPLRQLPRPVTLAEMKEDPQLAGWDLFRLSRLSIVPVSTAQWKRVQALARIEDK